MDRRMMAVGAAGLVVVASLAGCSSGDASESGESGIGATSTVTHTSTFTLAPDPATATASSADSTTCIAEGMNPATWNTAEDSAPPRSPVADGGIVDVSPGAGPCFDQVVFRTDSTSEVGFTARYVPQVTREGSGAPVPLQGAAHLQLSIFAPAVNPDLFQGFGFVADDTYRSLRQVAFAGSFEGVTTFGIGVDHETPFAVETRRAGDGATEVLLAVAH